MKADTFTPFVLLRAVDQVRGESLNAGVVLFTPNGALVGAAPDSSRIKALHPDFGVVSTATWAERLQESLNKFAKTLPEIAQQIAMLPLLCQPFVADTEPGTTLLNADDPQQTLDALMTWQVLARPATVRAKRDSTKRQSKLTSQMRAWFRSAKVFSTNPEDLSKGRVIANFPVDARDDLYADFAVKNGRLHVLETLDLRGIDHLTPSIRGDAAVKGFTLDEAKTAVDGDRIAVVSASNYDVARPAIKMIERNATNLYVMESPKDKQAFVDFMHRALHNDALPDFVLTRPQAAK
ncbi:DUF3037 domain-containing protein [Variovorax sp. 38R]|uniref:DUF3037 domain-containing protein n=1 Tax=Variovorax sp. 38R TaxID=2774875 RepID=UPI0017829771|nr:DUF3037 domain-containing protein [Variovorax sp. 38R]QOF76048.1 DUF3037 domain-containing protein [Variovorax sp. 38R]